MRRLRAFALGACEFFVGEDWRTALGIVVAIAATALLATTGAAAWWLMPVAVLVLLAGAIRRALKALPGG